MKKYLAVMTAIFGCAFADTIETTESIKTFYVDLDGAFVGGAVGPGINVGYRRSLEEGVAIDISGSFAHTENNNLFASIPSVQFLKYGRHLSSMNPYFGGGLSYAWYKAGDARFDGIFANATAGVEFFRKEQLMGSLQVRVSEPVLAVKSRGSLYSQPVVSVGLGFGF